MASLRLKDIDEIDDVADMVKLLEKHKIYRKGLRSLDEMKVHARKFLSKDKRVYPKVQTYRSLKAFTILLKARAENTRKREQLRSLFSRGNNLLRHLKKEESLLLPKDGRSILGVMERQLDHLNRKNFHILVAGETSVGKSSLINLIIGETLLPSKFLATTSTICELKYGKERKIVLHYKGADSTKRKRKEIISLVDSAELIKYVGDANEGNCSIYEKVEIYLPHELLENGITIVDSPGIGEQQYNQMVNEYLTHAFAFVYVIDSSHHGGIETDKILELMKQTMLKVFEKRTEERKDEGKKGTKETKEEGKKDDEDLPEGIQNTALEHEFQSNCALFLCNKWDVVLLDKKANPDEVKEDTIKKLKKCWPGLVEDQVLFMSVEEAKSASECEGVSDDLMNFMNRVGSMILKSFETRLEIRWRWLHQFLSCISYRATSFLVNNSRDSREKVKAQEKMQTIRHHLDVLKERQSKDLIDLRRRMDNTVHEAVQTLIAYLKSDGVRERFSYWTQDEVPKTYDEIKGGRINEIFQKRLSGVVDEWEENQFKSIKESLMQQIRNSFDFLEGQLCSLRGNVTGGFFTVPGIDLLPGGLNFFSRVFVKISWFFHNWLNPFSWIFKPRFLSTDPQAPWEDHEGRHWWLKSNKLDTMKTLSIKYLSKAAEESVLKPFVESSLKNAEECLRKIETVIPEQIEADKRLVEALSAEKRSEEEIKRTYEPILHDALNASEEVAFFGLREAGAANICSDWLEWNQGSNYLCAGDFSTTYRGKMTRHGQEQDVALKVFQEVRRAKTASRVIQEANLLSKLNHPHLVKFHGTAVVNENDDVKAILVMELCKGNLKDHLQSHPISVPQVSANREHILQAFKWVIEICSALDYIHSKRVVQRDLKLEKILLLEDNTVKLYDVSVCKEVDSTEGTFRGTPQYMAPEVLRSELNDFKSDIYSLGIMLWEIWYGRQAFPHFDSKNIQHFINSVSEGCRPKEETKLKLNKPPRLWKELMEKCWDGNPKKRPQAKECEETITKLFNEWRV